MMKITNFEKNCRSEKGSAILIVLALIAMLTAVAIMSVDRSTTDVELSYNQLHEDQAFYIAEAGMERSVIELNADSSWRNGYYKQVLNGGHYTVSMIDSLTDTTLIDTLILTSQGYFDNAISNVETWVVPEFYRPFTFAAYGDDSVMIHNNSCTDSYNSDSGTYAATQLNEEGNVGSNGEMLFEGSTDIYGGAQTSDTGNIAIVNPAVVHGDTTSIAPVTDNDAVSDEEFLWAKSVSNAPVGLSGSYSYNNGTKVLSVANFDTLTLASGVYYFSDVSLSNKSAIQLAPGAQVQIYMTGDLSINQFAKVNEGGSPSDLLVFSQGSSFVMGNNTVFNGGFWSKTADVTIGQHVELFGSVSGKSVQVSNFSCIHFDRDLLNYQTRKTLRMYVVAWRQT